MENNERATLRGGVQANYWLKSTDSEAHFTASM
jgi:hypothetical protein